jgi:hypothetical protein
MKTEIGRLNNIMGQHQRYLEALEAEKRAANLIFLGVPENKMEIRSEAGGVTEIIDDGVKVTTTLRKIGIHDREISNVERIGAARNGKTRPIKVTLARAHERADILKKAAELKTAGEPFMKIYIKKDIHPLVRREFTRLYKVKKNEAEKPENIGRKVEYDYTKRCVMVDGIVVDSFQASFFA